MIWRPLQWALVLLLIVSGIAAPHIGAILKLEPSSTGALTGALIGSAAAMLGALLTDLRTGSNKKSSDAARRNMIKTLITAELANIAAGYIGLQKKIRAASATISAGGSISPTFDLFDDASRSMPFTIALGTELLILSPQEIDVLSTLLSNLPLTQRAIRRMSTMDHIGWITITNLRQGVAHDMDILAQAFERFAPSRKLINHGQAPELAAALLRQLVADLNQT